MRSIMIRNLRAPAALALALGVFTAGAAAAALRDKWCSKAHLRFFVGGAEGDAFGTIVYNGARQAAAPRQPNSTPRTPRSVLPTSATERHTPDRRKPTSTIWSSNHLVIWSLIG